MVAQATRTLHHHIATLGQQLAVAIIQGAGDVQQYAVLTLYFALLIEQLCCL
ncbi:hypothetical protein D3C80_743470 [compost metagenome]